MSASTQGLTGDNNPMWSLVFWNKVHRYRCLLTKYWWLLALTLSTAIFAAAWFQMNRPVRYMSTGEMRVDLDNKTVSFGTQGTTAFQQDLDEFMVDQAGVIKGRGVSQLASDKLVARYPDMPHGDADVDVNTKGPTFTFTAVGSNPVYTQRYLQAVLEAYIEKRTENKSASSGQSLDRVEGQIPIAQDALNKDDEAIIKFQQDHHGVFGRDNPNGANAELVTLKAKLAADTDELNQLMLMPPDQGLDRQLASSGAGSPQSLNSTISSTESDYRTAQNTLVQLRAQMEDLSRDLKPKHPKIIALDTQIKAQNRFIASLLDRNRTRIQNRTEQVRATIQADKDQIAQAEPKAQDHALLEVEFDKLTEKKDLDLRTFNDLRNTFNTVALNSKADVDPVHITEQASTAEAIPSAWMKLMAVAVIAGLGVGIGILALIDRMDDRMNSLNDLQMHFDDPIIGQIPRDTSAEQTELLRPSDTRHQLVESFRNLRSTLLYMPLDGKRPKTILVTSAIPNEGKSTLSSNLALVMAFAGMKTLLIDGDLRRGEIHDAFGVTREPGFTDVLAHNVNWKIAIRTTGIENLHVLPRGRNVPQPSEYLLNKATDRLLQELYPLYDYIIIDSSPVLAADDTASLAPKIDATLFVVRLSFTPAKMTRKSLEILHKRQANVQGLILNQVDTSSPEFVYYQYSEYYHSPTVDEIETEKAEKAEKAKPPIEVS